MSKRKFALLAVTTLVAIGLTAFFTTRPTDDHFTRESFLKRVHKGMSLADVKAIFGEPARVNNIEYYHPGPQLLWKSQRLTMTVVFDDHDIVTGNIYIGEERPFQPSFRARVQAGLGFPKLQDDERIANSLFTFKIGIGTFFR